MAAKYKRRAEALRQLSRDCPTPEIRVSLLQMAETWDRMALRLENSLDKS